MIELIAKDANKKVIKTWEINEKIATQLVSLKEVIESMNIPFSISSLMYAKNLLNQKIEEDLKTIDITTQQLQDITTFSKICQEIDQFPDKNAVQLIIQDTQYLN